MNEELISLRFLENIMIEMGVNPIPPYSAWRGFSVNVSEGQIFQRLHILQTDDAIYDFIHNTIHLRKPDSTYYEVKVRKLEQKKKRKH
jgi:hypothetical protein